VKGIVFTLLEETIVDEHGMDAWDRILEEAGLDGVYTTLGNYPYEQLVTLLQAAEPVVGYSGRRAQQWFGRRALHRLADRYPELFEPHTSTREFALTLNDVIHPEVRKLYPGAEVPIFALRVRAGPVLVRRGSVVGHRRPLRGGDRRPATPMRARGGQLL
jgi:hypothetical protein